ncbi:LysR family transcriptional regulator [Paenibacillus cymbidii]|uniref:LysR family transcriptional regulator n=1 Tax=Paenibacillus cymbidii TaxID=1639034 RepID=UPI0010810D3C|nr:LysR family transcriptional regulator [Paenibacillus cymbidii]
MDLRQLRYFLMVANEGQVTSAAKRLNMEQPPLSRQLKLMEDELGVALFDRSGRRFELTRAGELLRHRAELLLKQFQETMQEVKELDDGLRGTLAIGAVVSCISLLPRQIDAFRQTYPNVTFKILEGDHYLLGEWMKRRMVELAVARLPFEVSADSGPYTVLQLPPDPFVAVLPAAWQPDPAQPAIDMSELARFPWLTLKTDRTKGMHERILQEFHDKGLEPHIICECSSVAVIISLVATGIGATLLPKSVMASFEVANIAVLDVANADLRSEVGVVWKSNRYLSKSARRFIEMFRE